jgi:hypothetical protein
MLKFKNRLTAAAPILAYLRDLPESGAILTGAKELTKYFARQRESFKATVPPPSSELRASASWYRFGLDREQLAANNLGGGGRRPIHK